nr:LytTR family DNA-binding domain-containing protein [uncultured Mucilaginibacter sp.]
MIRCIIVDDEPLAQDVLESHVSKCNELVLVKKCNNALDAFQILHKEKIDLILLDIQMPAINGVDFIKSLKSPPSIIFTTAFPEFAMSGFDLEAVDYLLKPITFERFRKSIDKLLKIQTPEKKEISLFTYFKVGGSYTKVLHSDILFAQSIKDYISLKTTQGNYIILMTMKYLVELLPDENFVRIHRSYLVNKSLISSINRTNIQIGDEVLPIGENYRSNIQTIKIS